MKVKLTEICTPKQWKTIPANELLDEGYPVYGANGIIGYYDKYNHENPVVTITCRGATCGTVNITEPKSYITGNAMCLDNVRPDILLEYLYYCLLHYDFSNVISGSAQPQITRQGLEKVKIATFVTILWQRKAQQLFEKRKIFTILMSKRYDIAAEESVEALNMIDVVFYSSKEVREAWNAFNDATNLPDSNTKSQTISDKHLRLLEVIAKDIGYKDIHWDNIKQYYYPIGLSTKKQDETVLRRVQIDAALAQIKEGQEHKETAQTDTQTTLNNQMLLKVLENPDSFIKLIDAAEKAQNLGKSTRQKR